MAILSHSLVNMKNLFSNMISIFLFEYFILNCWKRSEQSHNYESWMTFILSSHELKFV